MIRRTLTACAIALGSVAVVALPASATTDQYVTHPGGGAGRIYAAAPNSQRICANALSSGTTVSVTAYTANGTLLGQVIDAYANGVALCMNIGGTVENTYGKVEKQGKPNCYRRYRASRANPSGNFFSHWTLIGVNYAC